MMIIFMLKILFLKVPPWKRIPEFYLTDGFSVLGFFVFFFLWEEISGTIPETFQSYRQDVCKKPGMYSSGIIQL